MEDSVRKGAFRWCFRWVQTSCTKLCFGLAPSPEDNEMSLWIARYRERLTAVRS